MSKWALKARAWGVSILRDMYPFLICLVGGTAFAVQSEVGIAALLFGGASFVWAIDLATTRAAAQSKMETAAMLTAIMVGGTDTTVTVDINHRDFPTTTD